MKNLYPFKFEPILQSKPWGGQVLQKLGKNIPNEPIGESWEISGVEGFHSVVKDGKFKGKTLQYLLDNYGKELLGESLYERFGAEFPLLIKFIDAKIPLSIQVHPNDQLAKKLENGWGKTEMWYILEAEKDAKIYMGWSQSVNETLVRNALEEGTLVDLMNVYQPKKGDFFYVPAGTVHAIGEHVLLAEIQQTSNITYRLYDWDRTDAEGNSRELHLEKGFLSMDLGDTQPLITHNEGKEERTLISNDFFTTVVRYIHQGKWDGSTDRSFKIFICTQGEVVFESEGFSTTLVYGETLLVPQSTGNYTLIAEKGEVLEVYV